MENLLEIARMACEVAKREGAEFVDVAASRGRSIQVELEKGAIKSTDARWNFGVSIRAFVKGGLGSASSSGTFVEADIISVAKHAAELAKVAEPDPDFVSLPSPVTYQEVTGLYDEKIAQLSVKEIIEYATSNIDSALSVREDAIISGGASAGFGEGALVNSLGVESEEKYSYIGASITATIKRDDDVGVYFESNGARVLSDFKPEGIGAKATEEAIKFLGAQHIETKIMPVVFGPFASTDLFYSLCYNANAEDIQRRRSYLIGMKGELVASEVVTLLDDPLYPRGMSSQRHDGEGYPSKPLIVVERGVLKSYLHNSYTANKAKEENTGHSTRGGISPTNVRPSLGKLTAAEIIKDTKEGLYINMGSLSPNTVTGEVSATVDFGFKIENGELAYPVKSCLIGANMIELMKSIDAISRDYREEPGVVMPTIRAQNVQVAGGR
ncbi:TldD/PmbA family protein [Candidatus Poribacteria bacterium]|nr:TldD/PmbA family protein [Candidatus Poribacteria bacterium]